MSEICVRDRLTKTRTQSACRRPSKTGLKGRRRNWVLVHREGAGDNMRGSWIIKEPRMCIMARHGIWATVSGYGGLSVAASFKSLRTGRELSERMSAHRSDSARLGVRKKFFVSGELPFGWWGHEVLEHKRAREGQVEHRWTGRRINRWTFGKWRKERTCEEVESSWLRVRWSCPVYFVTLLCPDGFLAYGVCMRLASKNRSSVVWQKTRLQILLKWRWPDVRPSDNHELIFLDRAIAFFVLSTKICSLCCEEFCTLSYSIYHQR